MPRHKLRPSKIPEMFNLPDGMNKVVPCALAFIIAASLGIYFLTSSHTATLATPQETENGTVAGNASTVGEATASGGSAVKFGGGAKTWSCVSVYNPKTGGGCPLYSGGYADHPAITGIGATHVDGNDPNINMNVWSGDPTYRSTVYANSPSDWKVVAEDDVTPGQVLSFPNVGWYPQPAEIPVDSYSSINSSWNVTMPAPGSGNVGWAAYDLWFNGNWSKNPDEVMILTDVDANQYYDCDNVANVTISGITWYMCALGSERVWKPGPQWGQYHNQAVGSIDILALIKYMENTPTLKDKLPANSTLFADSFGFEICSTTGPQTFQVNNFTWDQH